jgi:hypothetical protein
MKAFLREAQLVPVIVGNLKRSKLMRKLLPLSTGGTDNARYCYSVWLRHLNYYMLNSNRGIPCKRSVTSDSVIRFKPRFRIMGPLS